MLARIGIVKICFKIPRILDQECYFNYCKKSEDCLYLFHCLGNIGKKNQVFQNTMPTMHLDGAFGNNIQTFLPF